MMLSGGGLLALTLCCYSLFGVAGWTSWPGFLSILGLLGFSYSLTLTPSGRLLQRSSHHEDRPTLFTAQFALSHVCWLITYPLAGRFGAGFGLDAAFLVMAALAALGVVMALRLWPATDGGVLPHRHDDLPRGHPHLREHGAEIHSHAVTIDDLHPHWPTERA